MSGEYTRIHDLLYERVSDRGTPSLCSGQYPGDAGNKIPVESVFNEAMTWDGQVKQQRPDLRVDGTLMEVSVKAQGKAINLGDCSCQTEISLKEWEKNDSAQALHKYSILTEP